MDNGACLCVKLKIIYNGLGGQAYVDLAFFVALHVDLMMHLLLTAQCK